MFKNVQKISKGIAAVIIGVALGGLIVVGAIQLSSFNITALAVVGLVVALVGLWTGAGPDAKAEWHELGTRKPRTWIGLAAATISTVLALAALFSLPFMRAGLGMA